MPDNRVADSETSRNQDTKDEAQRRLAPHVDAVVYEPDARKYKKHGEQKNNEVSARDGLPGAVGVQTGVTLLISSVAFRMPRAGQVSYLSRNKARANAASIPMLIYGNSVTRGVVRGFGTAASPLSLIT